MTQDEILLAMIRLIDEAMSRQEHRPIRQRIKRPSARRQAISAERREWWREQGAERLQESVERLRYRRVMG